MQILFHILVVVQKNSATGSSSQKLRQPAAVEPRFACYWGAVCVWSSSFSSSFASSTRLPSPGLLLPLHLEQLSAKHKSSVPQPGASAPPSGRHLSRSTPWPRTAWTSDPSCCRAPTRGTWRPPPPRTCRSRVPEVNKPPEPCMHAESFHSNLPPAVGRDRVSCVNEGLQLRVKEVEPSRGEPSLGKARGLQVSGEWRGEERWSLGAHCGNWSSGLD